MSSDFLVWQHKVVEGACILDEFSGFEPVFKLLRGVRVEDEFPGKARFKMDPEHPTDTMLIDSLFNNHRLLVCSERLRDIVAKHDERFIEFLPVTIVNHKGKAAKERYFIVNPVDPVDCLDARKSGAEYLPVNPNNVWKVKKLVLVDGSIPKERHLLRPKGFDRVILVSRRLSGAIDAAGCTGVRWVETDKYKVA